MGALLEIDEFGNKNYI